MPTRNLIWITVIIAAALVTLVVTGRKTVSPSSARDEKFAHVEGLHDLITESYYLPVDGNSLRRGAVNGMISMLDEFSSYISPDNVKAFSSSIAGKGSGVGLIVEIDRSIVRIVGPLVNSPAHHAGIIGGQTITAIDGQTVAGMNLQQVRDALDGPLGSKIAVDLLDRAGRPSIVELTRSDFPLETVQGLYRDRAGQWVYLIADQPRVTYVRVRSFTGDTGSKLREIIDSLGSVGGLILDLRDNPGGRLEAGLEIADLFLADGVVVSSLARGQVLERFNASANDTLAEFPVVSLVNAKTASAAEIVAGALKFHNRAVVVGTRTRGKGAVQSVYKLPGDLGQVNLTTSQLLLGGEQPITRRPGSDRWGVDPHPGCEVIVSQATTQKLADLRSRAEVLSPAKENRSATAGHTGHVDNSLVGPLLDSDAQLRMATELLGEPAKIREILTKAAAEKTATRPAATMQAE